MSFFTLVSTALIRRTPSGVPICYFPNSEIASQNYACDLSSKVSFCCGIDSICLDNKICQNTNNEHIRGACTDQSWTSPDCPQYCTGANTGGTDIISCQNVTNSPLDYCCDHSNNCCDTGVGRFRLADAGVPTRTLGSSASTATLHISSSTTHSTSTSTSSSSTAISSSKRAEITSQTDLPTLSPTPTAASSNSGLSTGAKVGIGVVIPVAVIVIAVLSVLLWRRSRKRATTSETQYEKPELDSNNNNSAVQSRPQELPGEAVAPSEVEGHWVSELPADRRWELPSQS